MLKRYGRIARGRHIAPRKKRLCMRSTWARDRYKVGDRDGSYGGHISSRRGGWLYQFFRYCGEDTSLLPAHDPLRWLDAQWLSPQRHNGVPILVGAMERERDLASYGVEEWA